MFLCLSSDCRGLGGNELARCSELLSLTFLGPTIGSDNPQTRAQVFRRTLIDHFEAADTEKQPASDRAILLLLGLAPRTMRQPRAIRRALAADAMGMALDTFQKRYEKDLLLDVADEIWRMHSHDVTHAP